jgi:cytochrome c1
MRRILAHASRAVGENDRPMQKRTVLLAVAATTVALGAVAALVAATVVYGGLYNVAATEQHFQPIHTMIEKAMRQSVRLRARTIEEPPLADEGKQLRGAGCFHAKCEQCHGAPGVAQGDIGKSMQPLPGPLVDARRHWRARELYWLTRHGIRMSGMPAWEFRLSDQELWDVVAFMQRLPDLNSAQYQEWIAKAGGAPACGRELSAGVTTNASTRPDVKRGHEALSQYACNACHIIPGVTGSDVHVGPSLDGIGSRTLIAGTLANTPENLARWLRETQKVKPGTAMPQLGVMDEDARDMAAYLGTLR